MNTGSLHGCRPAPYNSYLSYSDKDSLKHNVSDAEMMAALIDGRLNSRQTLQILLQLLSSNAAREVFLDAVAVTRELSRTGNNA